MVKLLALFVLVPAIELALLIELGSRVGTLATLGLIVFTGALGAALARWQGLGVLSTIRAELERGQMPTTAIVDGVMILIAAAVLMTPGLLTDAFGFLCLVPLTRRLIRRALWTRLERAVQAGRASVYVNVDARGAPPRYPDIDVTPERRERDPEGRALGPGRD